MTLIIFYLSDKNMFYVDYTSTSPVPGPVLTRQQAVIDHQGNLAWLRSAELSRYKNSSVVILSSQLKQEKEVLY